MKFSFRRNSDEKGIHTDTCTHTFFLTGLFIHYELPSFLLCTHFFVVWAIYYLHGGKWNDKIILKPFFCAQNGPGKERKETTAVK